MVQYIDKSALVAEIERIRRIEVTNNDVAYNGALDEIRYFLDTLEVKEVGISIPNIDSILEEEGIDPNSKDAKVFKECYYMALERFKEEKGEKYDCK